LFRRRPSAEKAAAGEGELQRRLDEAIVAVRGADEAVIAAAESETRRILVIAMTNHGMPDRRAGTLAETVSKTAREILD
jgi:hypothetical protein